MIELFKGYLPTSFARQTYSLFLVICGQTCVVFLSVVTLIYFLCKLGLEQ